MGICIFGESPPRTYDRKHRPVGAVHDIPHAHVAVALDAHCVHTIRDRPLEVAHALCVRRLRRRDRRTCPLQTDSLPRVVRIAWLRRERQRLACARAMRHRDTRCGDGWSMRCGHGQGRWEASWLAAASITIRRECVRGWGYPPGAISKRETMGERPESGVGTFGFRAS